MEKVVWVRKATGLTREIGTITAVIIILCLVIGAGWQKRVFQVTGWSPVPESTFVLGLSPMCFAFILTAIPALATFFCLGFLSAAMPRSGGGYIHISRVIHPLAGFTVTWIEFCWFWLAYGMISTLILESLMMFGGLAGWNIAPFVNPYSLFLWGTLMICIFAALCSFGVRWFGWLIQILFWIPALILLGMYAIYLSATPSSVAAGVVALTGHTAEEYTKAALAQGMATAFKGGYWDAVNVAVIGAAWAWTGFASVTFAAGEVKEASKRFVGVMMTGGIILTIFYVTISQLMANTAMMAGKIGDWSFFSAWGYLSYGGGDLAKAGLPAVKAWNPIMAAIAARGMGWEWIMAFLAVVGAFWLFNDLPPIILGSSRMIFAMAFDGMLPRGLADVNERWHSPIMAIWFTVVWALIGVASESGIFNPAAGGIDIGPLSLIFTTGIAAGDLWDYIYFTAICLTGALIYYRRRDLYDRSPTWKVSIAGVPLVAIVGIIGVVTNLWCDYVFLFNEKALNVGGITVTLESIFPFLFTLILLLIPVVLYFYYKARAKVTGVDYKTIFTEIPPE